MVTLNCPACGKTLRIADNFQGQVGRCNGCGGAIAVPIMAPPQVVVVRNAKTRFVFVLLGLFLGGLGMHNFYAGYTGRGFAQLLLTLCTAWLIIPILFIGAWVLAELLVVTNDATGQPFA